MLNDSRRGVKGITLLDDTKTTSQMFVDHTALFQQAAPENLHKMLSILNIYTEALERKLNYNKSVAIHIGHTTR